MYLERALFINRAPFEHLELNFMEKGVNVLSAKNGCGKTTVLSYIADAFHEMARPYFPTTYEGKEQKLYRLSSDFYNLDIHKHSLIYLRFKKGEQNVDYADCRGEMTEQQYNDEVKWEGKIQYKKLTSSLKQNKFAKVVSINKDKSKTLFNTNILTYFPAYRYECPGYLNDPYKFQLKFNHNAEYTGSLPNPIEVVSALPEFANWLMDVVLDMEIYSKPPKESKIQNANEDVEQLLFSNANKILNATLSSKFPKQIVRFGIGKRSSGMQRISIMQGVGSDSKLVYPNVFNLSSGESSLLCLFGEILRQADKLKVKLEDIHGIVLIDEIDKHLHIELQNEILPELFALFPNVQFIVSSHSPFLIMGLAQTMEDTSRIIDLGIGGVIIPHKDDTSYKNVYRMMLSENENFAQQYYALKDKLKEVNRPLIITEGKTDWKHLQKAQMVLGINIDVEYCDVPNDWGDSKLKAVMQNAILLKPKRKIICMFDRDKVEILQELEQNGRKEYTHYDGTNVYAFAIPLVNNEIYNTDRISIEHYYIKENLLKPDTNGRRLFLGEEFYDSGNSKDKKYQTKAKHIDTKVEVNGIIDEKVFADEDREQNHSIALSKNDFAKLVATDRDYISDFDFSNFKVIFDIIQKICDEN
ncbi:MAG: AAA family ATPase [Prevotellaceae bacterium]|nr:AAA family ATPase [Prevotellaceae bacterium]